MVPGKVGGAAGAGASVLAAPQVLPLPPPRHGCLDDAGGTGLEVVPPPAELREQSFPLQLAPELLEGALHAVTFLELDVRHGDLPGDETAEPPGGLVAPKAVTIEKGLTSTPAPA